MSSLTLRGSGVQASSLGFVGEAKMAEWKRLIMSALESQDGVRPYKLMSDVSQANDVDKSIVEDAFFLLLSSGELVIDSQHLARRA